MSPHPREPLIERVTITGDLDRRAIEALGIALRRLARQHCLDVVDARLKAGRRDPAEVVRPRPPAPPAGKGVAGAPP